MQFEFSHLSRRRFIRGLGATAALSILPGCRKRETLIEAGNRLQILNSATAPNHRTSIPMSSPA